MKKNIFLLAFVFSSLFSFGQWTQSLSYYANKCKIKIGSAVGGPYFTNYDTRTTFDMIVKNNFNMLVAENDMKYNAMEPTKGSFFFTTADKLVTNAYNDGMTVRGHTLCWHSQLPSWVNAGLTNGIANGVFTRATLMAVLKNHITTIMTHYKGLVPQWDVLNEPFSDSNGALRNSIWQQVIGNDYIDSVFVWAHRADPAAKLYLNDYSVERMGSTKGDAMFNYIKGMVDRNIPITGAGFQCHFGMPVDSTAMDKNINRYAAIGLEVVFTEIDVRILITDYDKNKAAQLALQADNYRKLIHLCLENPNCKTFITWGFTDLYSWIPSSMAGYDHALLFDKNLAPKPAYFTILNELALESQKTAVEDVKDDDILKIQKSDERIVVLSANIMSRCQVYDLQGKCIFTSDINRNEIEIPTNNFRKGIYILKVQLENGKVLMKKF
jgi:endo-1,4-beta-xylanase